MAAVLELLEQDFYSLLEQNDHLIDVAKEQLTANAFSQTNLDVPTLLAILELIRPNGLSFREAAKSNQHFPPKIEVRFLLALRRLRIRSTTSLLIALKDNHVQANFRKYAFQKNSLPNELSHLAVLAILVGTFRKPLLQVYFPELLGDVQVLFP